MKTNYLIVETEMSNGFPFDNVLNSGMSKDDALLEMHNLVSEYLAKNGCDSDDIIEEKRYVREDGRGNGYSLFVYSEDEIVDHIVSLVSSSNDTIEYKYIGIDAAYKMDAKVFRLVGAPVVDGGDGYYYKVEYIIRRPYEPEQPLNGEYTYDVHMLRFDGIEYNRVNEIPNAEDYVDSLEEIPLNVLVSIFNY